ncbi:MAG: type IV pili twitching motility protein PilT, partial [Candidatus Omnitrophica bacterium]|nr:type IV pili twitching motility protein PilT [Candidatus Omnitrophota bacterium]
MEIKKLLREMAERKASDLFYGAGAPVRLKVDGTLVALDGGIVTLEEVTKAIDELTTPKQRED